tara:strand:- start:5099 stop:5671 length:573 start_codon:yes stop_codon:yes gene_type:complete
MIRVGILGDIGSGKSFISKCFGYPVFNADEEVAELYKRNKKVFKKLNRLLPKYIFTFPIKKSEIIKAVLNNKGNLKKITNVIHFEIRKKLNSFLKNNKKKKIVILDIPLLLENKINNKKDILVFVQSKKSDIEKRLKKRAGFNIKVIKNFKKIQLSLDYKKKIAHFVIKNNFKNKSVKKDIKFILKKVLK